MSKHYTSYYSSDIGTIEIVGTGQGTGADLAIGVGTGTGSGANTNHNAAEPVMRLLPGQTEVADGTGESVMRLLPGQGEPTGAPLEGLPLNQGSSPFEALGSEAERRPRTTCPAFRASSAFCSREIIGREHRWLFPSPCPCLCRPRCAPYPMSGAKPRPDPLPPGHAPARKRWAPRRK